MVSLKTLYTCCALLVLSACGDDDGDDAVADSGLDASRPDGGGPDAGGGLDAGRDGGGGLDSGISPRFTFFVTSDNSPTANLGGLSAADQRCQRLATAVGAGNKTWRAYLSVERDPANGNQPTAAGSRIGAGPWYNVAGQLVASDITSLHARTGDAELFLTEQGQKVNGQWRGSPTPNQHDILTGTEIDGGVARGFTCGDWTLSDAGIAARVGHSDGLGPDASSAGRLSSWFSSHESGGCNDTTPRGGSGKIYCFALP